MKQLLRRFAKSDAGNEMAEYALALAIFSIVALGGWGVLANAADQREDNTQMSLCTAAVDPAPSP